MLKAKFIPAAFLGLIAIPLSAAILHSLAAADETVPQTTLRPPEAGVGSPDSVTSGATAPDLNQQPRSPFVLAQPKPVAPFPIVLNRLVQGYVQDFLDRPETLEASFDRSRPFFLDMTKELRAEGVPDDLVFLSFAESDFSKRGKGPWQFNKGTAKKYGLRIDRWVDERRDPILSTRAAAEYLADLHDTAGYDWRVAVVGWNVGDLGIDRFWMLRGENFNRFMNLLPGHTRALMGRFMAVAFIAHNSAAYGVGHVNYDAPPSYHEVPVRGGTTLAQVAGSFHTTIAKLHDLNPAILHDRVPPYAQSYKVRVPLVRTAFVD
ncbi:MAG: transglycosylase SLT domain-containing protein [Candidatus Binataceae bacterium]